MLYPFPLQCPRRIVRSLRSTNFSQRTFNRSDCFNFTSDEQCVASKDDFLVSVFEEIADAVLGMTRSVERRDLDAIANLEGLFVGGRFCHLCAVFATDDWD
jgi:hypothetical protein